MITRGVQGGLIGYDVRADVSKLISGGRAFRAGQLKLAQSRALNETISTARQQSINSLKSRVILRVSSLRALIEMRKASRSSLHAFLRVSGKKLSLSHYSPRPVRRGVTVNITGTRALWHADSGETPFMVRRFGRSVFARLGKKRLPIEKQKGPGLAASFRRIDVQAEVDKAARTKFPISFRRNLDYLSK